MLVTVVYIICGLIIGFFGRHSRFGFWGFFFATMLLTPFVSLLMLIAATSGKRNTE